MKVPWAVSLFGLLLFADRPGHPDGISHTETWAGSKHVGGRP